jgi:hypothetical protein
MLSVVRRIVTKERKVARSLNARISDVAGICASLDS